MNGIHDQHCRCRDCKPATARRPFGSVVPLHHDLPPHVRRNMDRIVWAVLLLASVCFLILAMAHR